MSILELKNIHVHYGGVKALDGVSLHVDDGEILALMGPNGAGKSTTINCIVGVAKITSGSIKIFGHDVESDYREARRQVGVAPQEFNVDIFGKVTDILDYVAGYYGLAKRHRVERVDQLLNQFSLTAHAHKTFQQLSGGLKRRVVLARALVHDPKLLILDEPTAGVDVELRRELWGYLQQLSKEGKTIILTSHYLEEVERLADRYAFIAHGQIVAQGNKSDFANTKTLEEHYLELTGASAVGAHTTA
jgi:ABC-2 type transport system ATP-binding protein